MKAMSELEKLLQDRFLATCRSCGYSGFCSVSGRCLDCNSGEETPLSPPVRQKLAASMRLALENLARPESKIHKIVRDRVDQYIFLGDGTYEPEA